MPPATGVFPQTLERFEGKELLDFARQSHAPIIRSGVLQTTSPSTGRCATVEPQGGSQSDISTLPSAQTVCLIGRDYVRAKGCPPVGRGAEETITWQLPRFDLKEF
jgi:hypothetical protein